MPGDRFWLQQSGIGVVLTAVSVEDMKGRGQVTCMTTRSYKDRHRLLVLHEETGLTRTDIGC